MEYINSNTGRLMDMYRSLDEKLSGLDNSDAGLPVMEKKALKEAYQTIAEIAGSMDYGLMESIIKDLKGYALPSADRERIDKIEGRLMELDWDSIVKLAGEGVEST